MYHNIFFSNIKSEMIDYYELTSFVSYCDRVGIGIIFENEKKGKAISIRFENGKWSVLQEDLPPITIQDIFEVFSLNILSPAITKVDFLLDDETTKLTMLESQMRQLFAKKYEETNRKLKDSLGVNNGIRDIFEELTGAVIFKDYEWNLLGENKLKDVFSIRYAEQNSYKYILPTDTGMLMRGAEIYYYFSCYIDRNKCPEKEQIKKWFANVRQFLHLLKIGISDYIATTELENRLMVAINDNLRNVILLCFNCFLFCKHNGESFCTDVTDNQWTHLIIQYQEVFDTYFNGESIDAKQIIFMIDSVLDLMDAVENAVARVEESFILYKCFNPLRETDFYLENRMAMSMLEGNRFAEKTCLVGLLCGGLELPFIIQRCFPEKKMRIYEVFQNTGGYLSRNKESLNHVFDINNLRMPVDHNIYLVDENIMSGLSLQLLLDSFFANGIKVDGCIAMRYPCLCRLAQITSKGIFVDLGLVNKYIWGLCCPTAYTKIKANTNYDNMYNNELHFFSSQTEVFLKEIYKNNSFIANSEADIFNGYSKGVEYKYE